MTTVPGESKEEEDNEAKKKGNNAKDELLHNESKTLRGDENSAYSLRRCRNMSPSYPPLSANGSTHPPYCAQSPEELFHCIAEDLNTIVEAADQSVSSAEQARKTFQTTFTQLDQENPRCDQLGIYGVLKDLREETMKAVFDVERSRLRAQKIHSEMTKLRRGLRNLNMLRRHEYGETSHSDGQWHRLHNYYD